MSRDRMDEIVFGQTLREPGYRVDFAIGTTYSLDLDTFISLPFSLGFLEEPDEVMRKSIPYIFSALRICSDNLAVFCNYSDITVPPQSRKVYYALMESSVFPINAAKGKNQIVNFHPKVWVVEQTHLQESRTIVKVIVMSRNLTKDGSLDCACVLTGVVKNKTATAKARRKHEPLCEFLAWLGRKASSKKRYRIERLIADIQNIESFDIEGSAYDDYDFLPMGIPEYSGKPVLDEISKSYRVAIVSPFIDDKVMTLFIEKGEKFLLTREQSLTQGALDSFSQENIYTMNPQMVDNELDESVDLHAKMYFTHARLPEEEKWRNYLYLGSTNATMGGFDRNVEFLMRFRCAPYKTSFNDFVSYFKDDPEKRFAPMIGLSETEDSKWDEYIASLTLRKAISSIKDALVRDEGDGLYEISLRVSEQGQVARLYPLMRPDLKTDLRPGLSFSRLSLIELTEFFVIETDELSRVIKVEIRGIPTDRDDAICRAVISSKAQFMDCISFLLSDSKTSYVIDRQKLARALSSNGKDIENPSYSAVYEGLLRESYESPDTFSDIQSFVESLPADVVPPEFDALYKKIVRAIKSFRR